MEKSNFARNGGLMVPIGFRFHPTDEELVVHYLKRKVYSVSLPASIIPELDVFQTNPWDLPGDLRENRYFFSRRKENVNRCSVIAAGCGYWKVIGQDKLIVSSGSNQVHVGMKKTFVFYQGKRPHGITTRWVMHQYCLVHSLPNPCLTQNFIMQTGDWVVRRIYQKQRKAKKNGSIIKESNRRRIRNMELIEPNIMDSMIEDDTSLGPPQASTSCSSGINELILSNELDQEATTDYCADSSALTSLKDY